MKLRFTISSNELVENMENQFIYKNAQDYDVTISNILSGQFLDELTMELEGDEENLIEFMSYYGLDEDDWTWIYN